VLRDEFGVDEQRASCAVSAVILRICSVAFCAFFVFSALFNYLPFYLCGPPFGFSTNILFYYLGGAVGITVSGIAWQRWGWAGVSGLGFLQLAVIFAAGIVEARRPPRPV
jgi:YNFM family putative membrane transporter